MCEKKLVDKILNISKKYKIDTYQNWWKDFENFKILFLF